MFGKLWVLDYIELKLNPHFSRNLISELYDFKVS